MKLTVLRNEREAALAVADRLCLAIAGEPELVLGLPTGRTPIPLYRQLVARHAGGRVSFAGVKTFNLDEFWRLPSSHPGSYRAFMARHLFEHVDLAPERTHFLDGMAGDAAAECDRYERAIAAAGGIDVQVLGIGANGHIGFNEPGPCLHARSHKATLKPSTRRANATFFDNDPARVPEEALSMGMATILGARRILLIAIGRGKRRAVQRMVRGSVTTRVPASFLQLHPDVEVVLDEAAGSW